MTDYKEFASFRPKVLVVDNQSKVERTIIEAATMLVKNEIINVFFIDAPLSNGRNFFPLCDLAGIIE